MASYKSSHRQYPKSKGAKINDRKKELGSIKILMDRKSPKARSEIIKYIEKYPDDMFGYYYYGKISQLANDLETAETAYQKVADSTSTIRCGGIVGLGEVARLRGQNSLAKKFYRQAIKESKNVEVYAINALSRMERIDGNYDEAFNALNLLPETEPSTTLEKARLLGIMDKHEESLQLLLSIKPETPKQARTIYYLMAMAYYNLERYDEAKEYFSISHSYNIKDIEHYKSLTDEARMHLELGEYQEAYDCANEAYQDGELQSGNVNLLMGLAKQGLGDYYEAMRNYDKSCDASSPTDSGKTYTASKFRMGCLKYAAEDFKGAIKDLTEAISPGKHSESSTLSLLYASFMRIKDYENAENMLQEMKTKYSNQVDSHQLELFELELAKASGKPVPNRTSIKAYRERQVAAYRKSEALYHIETEHQGKECANNFPDYINIKDFYTEVQTLMTEETKAINDTMDKYLIDYPNVGYSKDGRILHKICVVALPETKDILTMYPTDGDELIHCKKVSQAIRPLQQQENPQVAKFKSRFEKYNQMKK